MDEDREARFPGTVVAVVGTLAFLFGFAIGPLFFLLIEAP